MIIGRMPRHSIAALLLTTIPYLQGSGRSTCGRTGARYRGS